MMIILMHSPMPDSAPGYVLSCLSYLTAPGIGLFFMISGALLLGTELPMGVFLKKDSQKLYSLYCSGRFFMWETKLSLKAGEQNAY